MIFYRLGLQKVIEYFHLDEIFKEEWKPRRKPKPIHKIKLRASRAMDLCISILLSLISALVCLSIPYAALESPCEALKNNGFTTMYSITKYIEKYVVLIDRLIIALSIILVFISTKTVLDAINSTDINISPWLERGKYMVPYDVKHGCGKDHPMSSHRCKKCPTDIHL